MDKGSLSKAAARRIGRPDLAGQTVSFRRGWSQIAGLSRPDYAKSVLWKGEVIARGVSLGEDGIDDQS